MELQMTTNLTTENCIYYFFFQFYTTEIMSLTSLLADTLSHYLFLFSWTEAIPFLMCPAPTEEQQRHSFGPQKQSSYTSFQLVLSAKKENFFCMC